VEETKVIFKDKDIESNDKQITDCWYDTAVNQRYENPKPIHTIILGQSVERRYEKQGVL
jgi:hypothetical protein